MGVLKRQGIFSSIFTYIGFAIGAFNIFILYPNILTTEEFGLTRAMLVISGLIMQFSLFAVPSAMFKYYPYYRDNLDRKSSDYTALTFIVPLLGFIISLVCLLLFSNIFKVKFSANSILLVEYYYYLIPAALFYLMFVMLKTHCNIRLNASLPTFFEDIGYKIYTVLMLLLYYFKIINFHGFILFFCCYYFFACIPLYLNLRMDKDFTFNLKISKVTRRLKWKLISYTLFIYVGVIIGELGEYVAPIFVSSYKGLSYTAVLAVALYMVSILTVPQKALFGVSISILSDAWKRKDKALIERVYKKTSLNMMIIGMLIFVSIWLSIDQLLSFLPPEYLAAKPVILLMSLGKLFDLACGINNELLSTSNYWRFNFTSHILLLFLLIPLNAILISRFGLMGSAYASVISLTIYNSLRFLFIYKKFNLQPFSKNTLWSFISVVVLYFTINLIPANNATLITKGLSMLLRSGLFLLSFSYCILRFKLSEDLYTLYRQILERVGIKLHKSS